MKYLPRALVLLVALSGCSLKKPWIEGEWVFDKDFSISQLPNEVEFQTAKEWLNTMPDGTSLLISDGVMITERIEGSGSHKSYELVATSDPNSVFFAFGEDYAQRYNLEGGRIYTLNGKVPGLRFYYRRK